MGDSGTQVPLLLCLCPPPGTSGGLWVPLADGECDGGEGATPSQKPQPGSHHIPPNSERFGEQAPVFVEKPGPGWGVPGNGGRWEMRTELEGPPGGRSQRHPPTGWRHGVERVRAPESESAGTRGCSVWLRPLPLPCVSLACGVSRPCQQCWDESTRAGLQAGRHQPLFTFPEARDKWVPIVRKDPRVPHTARRGA